MQRLTEQLEQARSAFESERGVLVQELAATRAECANLVHRQEGEEAVRMRELQAQQGVREQELEEQVLALRAQMAELREEMERQRVREHGKTIVDSIILALVSCYSRVVRGIVNSCKLLLTPN
jgi:hypothetical protein